MKLIRSIVAVFAAAQLTGFTARADVIFELTFPGVVNGTRQHWDDPTYGSQARNTLQAVLDEFGRTFAHNRSIQLVITSSLATEYAAGAYTAAIVSGETAGSATPSSRFTGSGSTAD